MTPARGAAPAPLLRGLPALLAAFLVLLAGCAAPLTGVSTFIVGGDEGSATGWKLDWFHDGPPLVIRAWNRSSQWRQVKVICAGDEPAAPWPVWVPPHGEVRVLGQVMNRYAIDACWEQK